MTKSEDRGLVKRMGTHYCKAKTKAGKACKAVAVKQGLCAFHEDPQRAAQLGRKGGAAGKTVATFHRAKSILFHLPEPHEK